MRVTVRYLDGTADTGDDVVSVRVDGQFVTLVQEAGDQTIVNGNAIKCVAVSDE